MYINNHAGLLHLYNAMEHAKKMGEKEAVVLYSRMLQEECIHLLETTQQKGKKDVLYIPFRFIQLF